MTTRNLRNFAPSIALAVMCVSAYGQELTNGQKNALSELSSEQTQCYAYFVVSARCMKMSGANNVGKRFDGAADAILSQVIFSAKKAGLLDAAVTARVVLAIKDMARQTAKSCSNYSILLNEYGDSCKALAENPGPRFETLLLQNQ